MLVLLCVQPGQTHGSTRGGKGDMSDYSQNESDRLCAPNPEEPSGGEEMVKRLAETALRQSEEADLPEFLLQQILELCLELPRCMRSPDLVHRLLHQVEEFDSYAGTGCFCGSVGAATIQATLKEIEGAGG